MIETAVLHHHDDDVLDAGARGRRQRHVSRDGERAWPRTASEQHVRLGAAEAGAGKYGGVGVWAEAGVLAGEGDLAVSPGDASSQRYGWHVGACTKPGTRGSNIFQYARPIPVALIVCSVRPWYA